MKRRHAHARKGRARRQGQDEARNTQDLVRTAELGWLGSGEERSSEAPSKAACDRGDAFRASRGDHKDGLWVSHGH